MSLTRREFLQNGAIVALALGSAPLLSSCRSDESRRKQLYEAFQLEEKIARLRKGSAIGRFAYLAPVIGAHAAVGDLGDRLLDSNDFENYLHLFNPGLSRGVIYDGNLHGGPDDPNCWRYYGQHIPRFWETYLALMSASTPLTSDSGAINPASELLDRISQYRAHFVTSNSAKSERRRQSRRYDVQIASGDQPYGSDGYQLRYILYNGVRFMNFLELQLQRDIVGFYDDWQAQFARLTPDRQGEVREITEGATGDWLRSANRRFGFPIDQYRQFHRSAMSAHTVLFPDLKVAVR